MCIRKNSSLGYSDVASGCTTLEPLSGFGEGVNLTAYLFLSRTTFQNNIITKSPAHFPVRARLYRTG